MTALRLAIVGAGARSRIVQHATEAGDGVVVAIADPSPQARRAAALVHGAEVAAFADHRELLSAGIGLDAVFVTAPDHLHASIAIDFLRAGVPAFVEKPLAIQTADADALLAVAADTGTRLYVGHNMRHMPVITLMRDIIGRGEIGQVKAVWCRHFVGNGGDYYFKDWHAEREHSNSLLLQKGAHDIDVIHWLAGGYTRQASGMGALTLYGDLTDRRDNSDRTMPDWFSMQAWPPLSQTELNPVIDVEDLSMVHLALDNGVLASYEQCHYTPDYWRNYTVIGTEGRLENFGDAGGAIVRVWNHRTLYNPEGDAEYRVPGEEGGHGDADRDTVAEFIAFVRDGACVVTSPVAARNAVAAAVAATESLRDGSRPRAVPGVQNEILRRLVASGSERPIPNRAAEAGED